MRDPAGKQDLGTLDEIDIDSILSESIGTSGKPEVPSAYEPLPSLFEDDVVDVESILQEINASEQGSAPDLTPTDTADLLKAVEDELAEIESTGIVIDPEEITHVPVIVTEAEIPEMAEASVDTTLEESPELTTEAPEEPLVPTSSNEPSPSSSIELSTLLKQESEIMYIGPTPIPEVPDSLPASSTRHFLTRPKHPWTNYQKRSVIYASGILIWFIFASHIGWKMHQKRQALLHPPIAKLIPPAPPKPKPAEPVKTTLPTPPKEPEKAPESNAEAVSTPHGLEQKDGMENFEPVQCNLSMDSKNLKEDLQQCLRSAKVIDN